MADRGNKHSTRHVLSDRLQSLLEEIEREPVAERLVELARALQDELLAARRAKQQEETSDKG